MRYRRIYSKQNKDGSRTVVSYGPVGSLTRFFVDAFIGAIVAGLFLVGAGIHNPTTDKWVVWSFMVGVPLLAWYGRRAARRQGRG
jgi:hypothetical protein